MMKYHFCDNPLCRYHIQVSLSTQQLQVIREISPINEQSFEVKHLYIRNRHIYVHRIRKTFVFCEICAKAIETAELLEKPQR